ncbi:hypothetical protein B0T11DRAFT_135333 [Plectosphaerella cucumerina]|jgi:hypothetical protein|uniref:Uncharacterized protein n=1 Tax=Plectosphaerella cucumerina TaxID=40658 RepID=A0A8K0X0R1_9PEZI|nr:hypothetical protein B0T11DRAFT_135333 [Plectosphaerella cucumerina]
MAILDRFRFTSSRKTSYVTSDSASQSSSRSNKSNKSNTLKLAKSFSWKTQSDVSTSSDDSNDSNPSGGMCNTNDRPEKGVPSWLKKKNKKDPKKNKILHPSEKPLTLDNIQHQEMLSHFTWTFGNRRDSYDPVEELEGISPGTSRRPSYDGDSRPLPPGYDQDNVHEAPMFLTPDSNLHSRRQAVQMSD